QGAGDLLAGGPERRSIPTYTFPEAAALALARGVRHGEWRQRDTGRALELDEETFESIREVVEPALQRLGASGGWLDPGEVDRCLRLAGLRTPVTRVTKTMEEAKEVADEIGGQVVLKVISEDALHKSDVGGVVLGVEGEEAVERAFAQVVGAVPTYEGVLVQEYVPGGHEVLIGMAQDPNFGPMLVFGLGGVYVELLKDVAFRLQPITDTDASEMVRETQSFRLLEGYRNNPQGDVPALEEALQRVSALVWAVPELMEMDLNPVKVLAPGDGVVVVDARMRVEPIAPGKLPAMRDLPGVTTNPRV
ncbi:MAG TPA: acetate--CoA ligase family protein, partial [Acidimicrobiia bacterium]|nr:acetate--CoA ligase family protein [Acidimicrobiia bacterium]